jgi:hypothetical protein
MTTDAVSEKSHDRHLDHRQTLGRHVPHPWLWKQGHGAEADGDIDGDTGTPSATVLKRARAALK